VRIVALATEHRMSTTAEGIETEQPLGMLMQLKCDEMQGSEPGQACIGQPLSRKMLISWWQHADSARDARRQGIAFAISNTP
jgi:EAL domain-containing protein (putative c-di-GMP-specific phosphodiesterase class I)